MFSTVWRWEGMLLIIESLHGVNITITTVLLVTLYQQAPTLCPHVCTCMCALCECMCVHTVRICLWMCVVMIITCTACTCYCVCIVFIHVIPSHSWQYHRVNNIGKNVISEWAYLNWNVCTTPSHSHLHTSTCVRTKGAVRQSSRPASCAQTLLFCCNHPL